MTETSMFDWRHNRGIIQRQKFLFEKRCFCDVTLIVEKETITAHRFILVSGSPVFEAQFTRWHTNQKTFVYIKDVQPRVFKELLTYLYCEEINITPDNVLALLSVSKKYLVMQVIEKCSNYLLKHINLDNVINIMNAGVRYDEPLLAKQCAIFICDNADSIFSSEEFSRLSYESVLRIVESDYLVGVAEKDIYKACLRWAADQCLDNDHEVTVHNMMNVLKDIVFQMRIGPETHGEIAARRNGVREAGKGHNDANGLSTSVFENLILTNIRNQYGLSTERKARKTSEPLVINRFGCTQTGPPRWNCHCGQSDAIDFACDSNIMIEGVSLYSGAEGSHHNVCLSLLDCQGRKLTSSRKSHIASDGTPQPCKVYFEARIRLKAKVKYTVVALIQGQHSYAGEGGKRQLSSVNGKVRFEFFSSKHSSHGWSTVSKGQIPELIFREIFDDV